MPYNSNSDLPSSVRKKLSPHQQTIFRKAFNRAYHSYDKSKDENYDPKKSYNANRDAYAFRIAWSAAKKAKGKESLDFYDMSGEYIDRLILEVESNSDESEILENVNIDLTFEGAKFDDKEKTAEITVIRVGWSANERYYGEAPVRQIAEMMKTSNKQYKDHDMMSFMGRSLSDWASVTIDSWYDEENKEARAKVRFTENPNTVWIYNEAKKNPESIGVSIDAIATMKTGKAESKEGYIVENIIYLRSADYVTVPAAGGKIRKVAASTGFNESMLISDTLSVVDSVLNNDNIDGEMAENLSSIYDFVEMLSGVWESIFDTYMNTGEYTSYDRIRDLVLEYTEKKKSRWKIQSILCSVERFPNKSDAIKWIKDHNYKVMKGQPEKGENGKYWRFRQRDVNDFVSNTFRNINITDGVKAILGKLKSGKESFTYNLENNQNKEGGKMEITVEKLLAEYPDITAKLKERFKDEWEKEWEAKNNIEKMKSEIDSLKKEIEEAKEEKTKLLAEKTALDEKIKAIEEKEKRVKELDEILEKYKVTEVVKSNIELYNDLLSLEIEKSERIIKSMIESGSNVQLPPKTKGDSSGRSNRGDSDDLSDEAVRKKLGIKSE